MSAFRFQPPDEHGDLGPPPGPFRFRTRRRNIRVPGGLVRWAMVFAALIILFIIANVAKDIYADWLWFESVGYRPVYRLRIVTRIWLFFAGMGVFLAFFGVNVLLALRFAGRIPERAFSFGGTEPAAARRIWVIVGTAIALFVGVIFGTQAAAQWDNILLFMNSQSFGVDDPQFNKDIGFYVFQLPALNFIAGWSLAAVIITLIAVAAIYVSRVLIGGFTESSRYARPHVSILLIILLCLFIWRYWLQRYMLVFSDRGAVFGAAYTDIHAQLPVTYVLMGLAAVTAVAIAISVFQRRWLFLPIAATAVWVVAAIVGGIIYPALLQRFEVDPNELDREREYIARNIAATRAAYGLDRIEERPFPARNSVTAEEMAANPSTIQNIRLWDHRPLLQTLEQLQTIRPLYTFLNVDVDRYTIDGVERQVLLAARELDPQRLPEDARGWVNRRLQYTHGFGLAMVPVNEVVEEGLPSFFIRDIPPAGDVPVEQPRIYFGEEADYYIVVNSSYDEFDYASGDNEQAQNRFDGAGGVKLNSLVRRVVHSWKFGDFNLLISDALDDDSRLLYRRNIAQRIHTIAPFLRLDADPYLVVADGRLFWIQDAYTHTDLYPYSTRRDGVNYVRNSVKVVVDAYDGTVTFYLLDEADPIANVYDDIYPDLFTPIAEMPDTLRAHLRYPQDLFSLQSQLYLSYHIQDPGVFYNREDAWVIPNEVVLDQQQPVDPYYVIMRLPGEVDEEFVLFLPFSPARRNNTIAWMAARSDGAEYGKLLAFRFPTETLVVGPSQVESRIDQDTAISAQISLWNQSGSQVIRGNLLMIPIGTGNLFVEPIYLQATAGSLPELKRVVVANGTSIAMEPTLGRALEVVLGRAPPTQPETGDGSPTPAGSPTPPADETPQATSTAQPATAELPDDVDALIQEANASFERAQQLLREGDFAGYGEEVERLQAILAQLDQLTGE
jgi:uncharacterized membrane protein (UPF0182 family)